MQGSNLNVDVLIGKTLTNVHTNDCGGLIFTTTSGERYKMYHEQDCCEYVELEEVIGDFNDLIGSPITMAEEVTQTGGDEFDSHTWTFYKFATNKGYVTLRWFGKSNGHYSERVRFVRLWVEC